MLSTGFSHINVGDWIGRWARIQPDKTALISEGQPYTYRRLHHRINQVANYFLSTGFEKGDRVAILLRNSRQYLEVFFAVSKIGGILVPLNWRLATPELEFIIRDSGATWIVFEDHFAEAATRLCHKITVKHAVICSAGESAHTAAPVLSWAEDYEGVLVMRETHRPEATWVAGDEDPHILMYTSGTTGLPKGAILSHKKTFYNALNAGFYYDLNGDDISIVARPLFHSGGLIVDMAPVIYRGGTIILQKRFTPREILETVDRYKVTVLELPATVYNFILREWQAGLYDLSSLKCCFTGGERVPQSLLKSFADRGILISQIYGLTEASTLFWLPLADAFRKLGSVGKPVFHGEIRIVDEQANLVNPGEIGEIIVRGPIVMNGYWNQPKLTEEVIRNGWLYTGDLALFDDEGFVYIIDRKKDMFISGGENIYPAEVEKALLTHPGIIDAAVVAVHDKKWGEVGKAFIVLAPDTILSPETIASYLRGHLAGYKIPAEFVFLDSLPKTASGKTQKRLLPL